MNFPPEIFIFIYFHKFHLKFKHLAPFFGVSLSLVEGAEVVTGRVTVILELIELLPEQRRNAVRVHEVELAATLRSPPDWRVFHP